MDLVEKVRNKVRLTQEEGEADVCNIPGFSRRGTNNRRKYGRNQF